MKMKMIFSMVLTTSLALSGCAGKTAVVGGMSDMIPMPKGSVIQGVKIQTPEGEKTVDISTKKKGRWISDKGLNRIVKATSGSNPQEDKDEE